MVERKAGVDAVRIIKEYEGLMLTSYQCPAGIWTIGWGHTRDVKKGQRISIDLALLLLQGDIAAVAAGVNNLVKVAVTQYQFDALVSFAFNVGLHALQDSTLLMLVNDEQWSLASLEFVKWVHAGGKVLAGLVSRRYKEQELFRGNLLK